MKKALRFSASVAFGVFALLQLLSCDPKPSRSATSETKSGSTLASFLGHPARVVWTRAQPGSEGDVHLMGGNHQLMILDSAEGTERVLLEGEGGYQRPLLTPDGETVIYTDPTQSRIHAIDWKGAKPARLVLAKNTAALDVYEGSEGQTMILAGSGIRTQDSLRVANQLIRFDLADPLGTREVVWSDGNPISLNGFEVSEDGRHFIANLPWPDVGIGDLETGEWRKAGQGCWPSLGPNESELLWIFDGTHQKATFYSPSGGKKWVVRFDEHPSLQGHEIYHPRWTPDGGHLLITGPYPNKSNSGHGKVGGGGKEAEIWLGRFSADLSGVEEWIALTNNSAADFMPDLWTPNVKELDLSLIEKEKPDGALVADISGQGWRMEDHGLVYLWQNRTQKNELRSESEGEKRRANLRPRNAARFGPSFQLNLEGGHAEDTGPLPRFAASQISKSQAWSIEFLIETLKPNPSVVPLLELGSAGSPLCLRVSLLGENLLLNQKGLPSAEDPTRPLLIKKIPTDGVQHLLLTFTDGSIRCYLNGLLVGEGHGLDADLSKWNADRLEVGRSWNGWMSHLAIYDEALDENIVYAKFESLQPILKKWVHPDRQSVRAKLVQAAPLPKITDLGPYRRGLVIHEYEQATPKSESFTASRFLVAHWVILDGQWVSSLPKTVGQTYELELERYEDHPELEGEWTAPYENSTLPFFFDSKPPILK